MPLHHPLTWDWDYGWHWLGGFALTSLVILSGVTNLPVTRSALYTVVIVLLLFWFGYDREKNQQRERWVRLSLHKWIEALTWPLGGICASPWLLLY